MLRLLFLGDIIGEPGRKAVIDSVRGFKEDQGVVAEGQMDTNGELVAKRVLARHDETYMPKEAYDALRKRAEAEAAAAKAGTKAPGT